MSRCRICSEEPRNCMCDAEPLDKYIGAVAAIHAPAPARPLTLAELDSRIPAIAEAVRGVVERVVADLGCSTCSHAATLMRTHVEQARQLAAYEKVVEAARAVRAAPLGEEENEAMCRMSEVLAALDSQGGRDDGR